MPLKITIITVSFNASKTIGETIKSILSQTYPNIEYIVKDGGSTDDTLKIINGYKNKIFKIISKKDKGLYDAMNVAVKEAKGDVIYFLNADDVFVSNNIVQDVVVEFEKNPSLDMVFGDVEFFYPKENKKVRISRNASINYLRNGVMPPHQGAFIKKKWLEKYPFDINYKSSADFDFFCNFFKEKPKIKKINKVTARMTMGGVSSGSISYKETQEVIKKHFGKFYYCKIKIKHLIFGTIKRIFRFFKINYHKA